MKKILLISSILMASFVASFSQYGAFIKNPEKAIYISHLKKYIVAQENGLLIIDEDRRSNAEHFKYTEGTPSIDYVDSVFYAAIQDFLFVYPEANISNEQASYNNKNVVYHSIAVCPGSQGYDIVAILDDPPTLGQIFKPNNEGVSEISFIPYEYTKEKLRLVAFNGDFLYLVTSRKATSRVYRYDRKEEKMYEIYKISNDPNLKDIAFNPDGNMYMLFTDLQEKNSCVRMLKPDGEIKVLIEKMEYATGISYRADIRSLVVTHPFSNSIKLRLIGVPPPVKLQYPENNEVVESKIVQFKWEEIEGAAAYELETSENREMTLFTKQYYTVRPEADPLKFQKGKTYYWRVRATNMGELGDWSEVFEFKISENDIPAPTLISPEDNSKNVSLKPYLSWTKYKPNYRYHFQVSTVNSFAAITINGKDFMDGSYQVVHELKPKTTYYWRVRTYANLEDPSPWSEVFSFTTSGLPPTPPTLQYPLVNQINVERNPRFRWSEVTGAESYELNISISPKYDHPDSTFYYNVKARPGEAEQTFVLTDTILMYNTHYYFRVKAITAEEQTDWSESRRFQVINKKNNNGGGGEGGGGGGEGGGGDTSSVSQTPELVLYPQPVKDVLFVSLDNSELIKNNFAGYRLRIVNAAGREIREFSHAMLSDKLKIDASRLDVGVYNLIIELNGKAIISKKFIKE